MDCDDLYGKMILRVALGHEIKKRDRWR